MHLNNIFPFNKPHKYTSKHACPYESNAMRSTISSEIGKPPINYNCCQCNAAFRHFISVQLMFEFVIELFFSEGYHGRWLLCYIIL